MRKLEYRELCSSISEQRLYNPWGALFPRIPFHKRKGGQVRFSNNQTIELEKKFGSQKYLSPTERKKVAKRLHLTERQVWKYAAQKSVKKLGFGDAY